VDVVGPYVDRVEYPVGVDASVAERRLHDGSRCRVERYRRVLEPLRCRDAEREAGRGSGRAIAPVPAIGKAARVSRKPGAVAAKGQEVSERRHLLDIDVTPAMVA